MLDLVLFSGATPARGYQDTLPVHIHRLTSAAMLRKIVQQEHRIVIIEGSMYNRMVVEQRWVDVLYHPEKGQKKDSLDARATGLDEVMCRLAKKNTISIGYSFSEILNAKDQALLFGRISAAIKLCRKFDVPMLFASFAMNERELRQTPDLLALLKVLGMTDTEAKKALERPMGIVKEKEERKSLIIGGIRKL